MIKNFVVGFTIGYIVVGLFITISRTSKHNMELYNDTRIYTDM